MRIVKSTSNDIVIKDKDDYHEYYLGKLDDPIDMAIGEYGHVNFQKGPIGETGVNGCQNEDLLAIVIDRLEYFQNGLYACRENALALTKIQEALHWLEARTADREERGVEGTNVL